MRITLLAPNLMTLDSFCASFAGHEQSVVKRLNERGFNESFAFLSFADGKDGAEVFYAVSTKADALRNMKQPSLDFLQALADANADARADAQRDEWENPHLADAPGFQDFAPQYR